MNAQLVVPVGHAFPRITSLMNWILSRASFFSGFLLGAFTQWILSLDSGDSHPIVLHNELRRACDGAWYPFEAKEGEPSFTSFYGDSAEDYWEMATLRNRHSQW